MVKIGICYGANRRTPWQYLHIPATSPFILKYLGKRVETLPNLGDLDSGTSTNPPCTLLRQATYLKRAESQSHFHVTATPVWKGHDGLP
jgi:hypothetical protein